MSELYNVRMESLNVRKKKKELPNVTKVLSNVMLELHNVRMEPSNMRKIKKTTKCDKRTVTCRGVHGSGGLGLCPTRNRPIRVRVGRFSTHNRPVKRVRFCGSVCRWVASVSSEVETRRKTQKKGPKSARSRPIWPSSGEDFVKSDDFSPKSCPE